MYRVLRTTVLTFLCTILAAAQEGPVVQTAQGLLRGVPATDGDYNQFLGIRYGTINQTNRFKVAFPPPTWEEIRDANEDIVPCPQNGGLNHSEDCLFLNVYVPKNGTVESPLPVMVFIHGGAFSEGDGGRNSFGPQFIIRHGVLLVAINYRLGPLGFICLGTEEIPGNAGLKDQVYALRWVRDNIAAFGGDPDNVTIFGFSAGSMSVEYLVISPMASGLFHKAISQSGSALAPSAVQRQPVENVFELGSQLGITSTDVYQLQESLLNKSAAVLIQAEISQRDTLFSPCAENPIDGTESFLTKSSYDVISSGTFIHVPYMMGFTDKEGIYFLHKHILDGELQHLLNDFQYFLPNDLSFPNEIVRNEVFQRIYQFYFNQSELSLYNDEKLIDYFTDYMFHSPAERTIRLHLKTSNQPIYLYEFRYMGKLNLANDNINTSISMSGASHSDEHRYLFTVDGKIPDTNAEDQLMIDRMTLLWTNFAKYGNPTPGNNEILPVNWLPVTADSLSYLVLDKNLVLDQDPYKERLDFWKDIYDEYFIDNFVTDNSSV